MQRSQYFTVFCSVLFYIVLQRSQSFTVFCSVLFYSVLQRSLLQRTAAFSFTAYCSVLFYSVLKSSILQCTAAVIVFYSVLQRSLLQCSAAFSFRTYWNVLFYSALQCSLLSLAPCFFFFLGGGGGGRKSGTGMAQCRGPGVPTQHWHSPVSLQNRPSHLPLRQADRRHVGLPPTGSQWVQACALLPWTRLHLISQGVQVCALLHSTWSASECRSVLYSTPPDQPAARSCGLEGFPTGVPRACRMQCCCSTRLCSHAVVFLRCHVCIAPRVVIFTVAFGPGVLEVRQGVVYASMQNYKSQVF